MSENLRIIHRRLAYLIRLRADLDYSAGKMSVLLEKIRAGDIEGLTPAERETVAAFTSRFAVYQE